MQLTDSCTPSNHPCLHNYIKSDFAYLITSHYDRKGMEDAEFSQMSEYFRHHLTMLSNGLTWKLDARVDMTKHFIRFSKTAHSGLTVMQTGTELKVIDLIQLAASSVDFENKYVPVLMSSWGFQFLSR